MAGRMTVELKQVRFFAYHGFYPEERKTGNEFEVNLAVTLESHENAIVDITSTVNYAVLFEIVSEQMRQPVDLLETLVEGIAAKIRAVFPQTKKIIITVSKLHPPIAQFTGSVSVTLEKDY